MAGKESKEHVFFLFSFLLEQKETKIQDKNMVCAPHGILRISRSTALH